MRSATAFEARLQLWVLALRGSEKASLQACVLHRMPVDEWSKSTIFYALPKTAFPEFVTLLEQSIEGRQRTPLSEIEKFEVIKAFFEYAIIRFMTVFGGGSEHKSGSFPVSENRKKGAHIETVRDAVEVRVISLLPKVTELERDREAIEYWQTLRDQSIASDGSFIQPEVTVTTEGATYGTTSRYRVRSLLLDQKFEESAYLLFVVRAWQWAVGEELIEMRASDQASGRE